MLLVLPNNVIGALCPILYYYTLANLIKCGIIYVLIQITMKEVRNEGEIKKNKDRQGTK